MKRVYLLSLLALWGCGFQDMLLFQGDAAGIYLLGPGAGKTISPDFSARSSSFFAVAGSTDGDLGGYLHQPLGSDFFVMSFANTAIPTAIGQVGLPGTSGLESAAVDSQGNRYLGYEGKVTGASLLSPSQNSSMNCGVMKFSSSGQFLWATEVGDSDATDCERMGVLVDSQDRPYFAGSVNGGPFDTIDFGFSQTGVAGNQQTFAIRMNPTTGAAVWSRQFSSGANRNCAWYDMKVDAADNLLISFFANATLGGTLLGGGGNFRYVLASLHPTTGNVNWMREQRNGAAAGGSSNSYLVVAETGDIYMYGHLGNTTAVGLGGTLVGAASTGNTSILSKFDSSGNWQWAMGIAGGGATHTSGTFIVDGTSVWGIGTTTGNLGGSQIGNATALDGYVVKINAAGGSTFITEIGDADPTTVARNGNSLLVVGAATNAIPGLTLTGTLGSSNPFGILLDATTGAFSSGRILGTGTGMTFYWNAPLQTAMPATLHLYGSVDGELPGKNQVGTHGVRDALVVKWSALSNTPEWITQIGAAGVTSQITAANLRSDGRLLIVGTTDGVLQGSIRNALGISNAFSAVLGTTGSLN